MRRLSRALLLMAGALTALSVSASEQRGVVLSNGLPVPGATVTAVRDGARVSTTTDMQGAYSLPELADGSWQVEVSMQGFAPLKQEVSIGANASPSTWDLKMLSLEAIDAKIQPAAAVAATAEVAAVQPQQQDADQPKSAAPKQQVAETADEAAQDAADGLLINGSINNGAASPFAQAAAFGNNRFGGVHAYNGMLGMQLDNSALDARPYALAGGSAPKADYNRLTGLFAFGGPIRIPKLVRNGPNVFVGYQWSRYSNSTLLSALMPTLQERSGIFPTQLIDPLTGGALGNSVPGSRISPQALALLNLYPLPNVAGNSRYNYQTDALSPAHTDALQSRVNKNIGRNNQLYGGLAFQSVRRTDPNVFGFADRTSTLGMNVSANWWRRLDYEWSLNLGYQFSRLATHVTPFFDNRQNVSGDAGIAGSDQNPANWGPPALLFSNGIAGLSDAQSSFDRTQSHALSYAMQWNRRGHNVTFGGDYRRREFNVFSQRDARGMLTFTGAESGSPFADFLLGIPDAVSIASGNPDKYFRQPLYDAFVADDWRVNAGLTLNLGMRWEYGAPVTELRNRLVNLDLSPDLSRAAPVLASDGAGSVTQRSLPSSLVQPDRRAFEPRLGLAWKPIAGSSLVVRAGYGVYYDTSVYQTLATEMSQQPPFSKVLNLQNGGTTPLTLVNAFMATQAATSGTFAVNPNFRVGYAQNWQLSLQRDLPGALQMIATYQGIKGTHAVQALLPNTVPPGAVSACGACPAGFAYLTSGGNSTREAGQLQLRRRLRAGMAGSLLYTYSKSLDDAAILGGLGTVGGGQGTGHDSSGISMMLPGLPNLAVAQDWRNPRADRGPSTFDQRHALTALVQYTTGMGLTGGGLLSGTSGALLKGWTAATQITAGSGLPQTAIYLAPVPGTAITGTIRANYTGAPIYTSAPGLFLNPAAFTAPTLGAWGDAARGSIVGPAQLTVNASLARTFKMRDRLSLDLRVDAANVLNHVTYTAWNTTVNSAQFGVPAAANPMRSLQSTLRMRF